MPNQLRIPATTTRQQYVQLGGGLDLLTPILQLKPGYVRDALNFEQSISGGYTRINGYERFDGQAAPSAALYFTITTTLTSAVTGGDVIDGVTSTASGTVISVTLLDSGLSVIAYTLASGTFVIGEAIKIGVLGVGAVVDLGGAGTAADYDVAQRALAANVYRALILPVPGGGPIRGGFFYNATCYAFRDNFGATDMRLWQATPSGWLAVATPTLFPGGRVQTDLGNFDGTQKVYGCDGVNQGWQFDGTAMVMIATGNVPDIPRNVLVHKDHLWFSFGDNLQNSGIADPLTWTALSGSASYRCGGTVTALARQPGSQAGGAMSISTDAGTEMIYGSSAADFQHVPFEESAGARLYGVQRLGGQTIAFGNIGAFSLTTAQEFGNFQPASMTMKIRPFTQTRRDQITGSLVNREKSQYRVFFGDGYGLYLTILNGKLVGTMPVLFPNRVRCAWQGESSDGGEASYFGDDDGYVHRLDAGTSHDGVPIDAYMVLAFANQNRVRMLKRYRRASFELQGESYAEFRLSYELNYGVGDRPQGSTPTFGSVSLSTLYWDSTATWDQFSWDGRALAPETLELGGSGENIALRIESSSDKFDSFTFNSVVIDYSLRRALT